MNEPRPAMISARPPESRSSVAKSWKTRTGSSELSTETALVSRMRLRARRRRGQDDRRRGDRELLRWCSPTPNTSSPTWSASSISSSRSFIRSWTRERRIGQLTERVDPEFHHSVTGSSRICGGRGTSREAISASRPATALNANAVV